MAFTKESKQNIIAEYANKPKDTGSPEVQIALLTGRINYLVDHLKVHAKDMHSKKGLLDLISQRKRMITYLKDSDYERYKTVIKKLGIRK
ncbi:MAG: 30S ribosomal protein S15 [Spirochaetae bacterium HGW-Spirochaetae-6]|nr:MAG: 30S ribosomal protein S15 [Spirochaetae bacterium HGW-Spirochaetae-6]